MHSVLSMAALLLFSTSSAIGAQQQQYPWLANDAAAPMLALLSPSPASSPLQTTALESVHEGVRRALAALPSEHLEGLHELVSAHTEGPLRQIELVLPASDDSQARVELVELQDGAKELLRLAGVRFVDITDAYGATDADATTTKTGFDGTKPLQYRAKTLSPVFELLSLDRMRDFLTKYSDTSRFRNRYYRASTGVDAAHFLMGEIKREIEGIEGASARFFEHTGFPQPSIIVRFEPTVPANESGITLVSAHLDSTNLLPFLAAPGADDDGSGTTTLLESLRALAHPATSMLGGLFSNRTKPVEMHWYAAEEGGLLGSQQVAKDYAARGVKVDSMLQMDMTAWVKQGSKESIGIITDFVDPGLTKYMLKLVDEYTEIKAVETKCGYACSDHASWLRVGVPSAFTIESTFEDSNHNIHSGNDRIDYSPKEFSFEHMRQFSRLVCAMVLELAT